ncbi:MFS family transporter [Ketogulonicigenium vulgare Y25]|uniref:MFS transporter n=1 Tax=Ketogulonicigenium vulgare TaxID=92945 RepID=UPI0001E669B9|nr:MFS transporter [Ketogulonicigenium vulgare]ADO42948.1 MFS family transporter [Ketogulonicigenium vulgare Y25]
MTDTTSARDDVSRNIYIVMAAGLAGSANIRSLDSVLPQISGEMGVSLGQAAYLGAGYALAYGLCQLPFGMLGDRMNRLFLVKVLTCLSVALLIVTAFAPNYPALLGLRILAGAASSAIIPLSISYIGDNVPFERRQMVLAMNMTAITTGMVLGQAFGGIVADVTGWRGIPIFIALLYLPAVVGFWGQKRSGGARCGETQPIAPWHRPWADRENAILARRAGRSVCRGRADHGDDRILRDHADAAF